MGVRAIGRIAAISSAQDRSVGQFISLGPFHVVTIDDRFDGALIRAAGGLMIEVRPITDSQPWIDSYD